MAAPLGSPTQKPMWASEAAVHSRPKEALSSEEHHLSASCCGGSRTRGTAGCWLPAPTSTSQTLQLHSTIFSSRKGVTRRRCRRCWRAVPAATRQGGRLDIASCAAHEGYEAVVQALLQAGADADKANAAASPRLFWQQTTATRRWCRRCLLPAPTSTRPVDPDIRPF